MMARAGCTGYVDWLNSVDYSNCHRPVVETYPRLIESSRWIHRKVAVETYPRLTDSSRWVHRKVAVEVARISFVGFLGTRVRKSVCARGFLTKCRSLGSCQDWPSTPMLY